MRPPKIPKHPAPEVVASDRLAHLRADLDAAGTAGRAAVLDRFWAAVAAAGTPLVEPRDGEPRHRTVTFLWRDRRGNGPGTREVVLLANKLTDPSVWDASTLERLPGTDVWHRSFRLRADWRATYQLAPADRDDVQDGPAITGPPSRWGAAAARATSDPYNIVAPFPSRYGVAPHSVVELPDAPPQPWVAARDGVPRGTVAAHRVASAILGNERDVWLYTPAPELGAADAANAADALILLDGEDWATRLPAATILDNLIAAGAIPPTVAIMPSTVDNATRWRELACSADFVGFLAGELLPWAASHRPLAADPARTTLAGRSLGGLTALFAALRAPERFGRVLSQSASLWWPSATDFDAGAGAIVDAYVAAAPVPVRFHLEVGLQEWALLARHRHLRDVLALKGHDLSYVEYHGGHDALCWQGGLADGLVALTADRRAAPAL
ncbi:Enterochelin esterase [Baekduia alba]|uniref:enterochelin esterase n=1 Tax=Baekduia alba TaxID=2997333 RepID=UPI002340E392|nr:enterochelin esterase [Baekduia alba]WCB95238.1 Enterochelin esterase [Baekduia alba]